MKSLLFLGIVFLLVSCSNKETETVNISSEGLGIENENLDLVEPFVLDSIQYSSSKTSYLLLGSVRYNNDEYSFSIISNSSPKSKSFEIERQTFPLKFIDTSQFDCILTYRKAVCEITWRNENGSLYLRNSISEGR